MKYARQIHAEWMCVIENGVIYNSAMKFNVKDVRMDQIQPFRPKFKEIEKFLKDCAKNQVHYEITLLVRIDLERRKLSKCVNKYGQFSLATAAQRKLFNDAVMVESKHRNDKIDRIRMEKIGR